MDTGEGEGADFNKLKSHLLKRYVCHDRDVPCWRYGDATNRKRLYVVAVNKRHGARAKDWRWPEYTYDEAVYPIAADVCVADDEVDPAYILEFSSRGNTRPVAFVDSSNKPDPGDGKCQYGFDIKLTGGPVIFASKKHSHVGLSAAHNEYMALHWCNRQVVWLRELLNEIGLREMIAEPTVVRGDNKAANTLCYEDIITTGNQFIYTPYHFNKEVTSQRHVRTLFVRSPENDADLTTKAVKKGVHTHLIGRLTGYEIFTDEDAENWSKEKAELNN